MSTTVKNEYDLLLKNFVNENMDILLAGKRYRPIGGREGDREFCLNYMPEHNETPEPNYIGKTNQFRELVSTFVDRFIKVEGVTFDLQSHIPNLHGKSLSDLVDATTFENRDTRYFCRENMLKLFHNRLLMDVFTAFIDVRDKKTDPTNYFVFLFDDMIEIKGGCTCPACDAYLYLYLNYEKKSVILFDDIPACKLPKKPTRVNVSLKSPSGKLVFLNHPGQFFKLQRDDQYDVSINSTLGCIEETKFHAKHNIGYFFIGNTTAYIMQKDGEILATLFDEDDEKQAAKYADYKLRGDVCTGVWWYTVLDHDLYLQMCAEHNVDPASIEHTVVKTKALKYKVSHSLAAHTKGHHVGVYSKITY
jgi:hypothetical protein